MDDPPNPSGDEQADKEDHQEQKHFGTKFVISSKVFSRGPRQSNESCASM